MKTFYQKMGQGRPVVVLHGWGISSSNFKAVQKYLSQRGYQVFNLDLPGFGRTEEPEEAWGVSDYANFVLEFARKHRLSHFFLVGHSFGGRIGIKLAASHPEKLIGLVLVSSAGLRSRKTRKRLTFLFLAKIFGLIFSLPLIKKFKEKARRVLYRAARARDYLKLKGVMKQTFIKVVKEDLRPFLAQIKVPTLVVWGEKDQVTPLSDASIMKKEIRGAVLKVVEGADHRLPYQKPAEFSKIVLGFFQKLR